MDMEFSTCEASVGLIRAFEDYLRRHLGIQPHRGYVLRVRHAHDKL